LAHQRGEVRVGHVVAAGLAVGCGAVDLPEPILLSGRTNVGPLQKPGDRAGGLLGGVGGGEDRGVRADPQEPHDRGPEQVQQVRSAGETLEQVASHLV
jgi:hypothetical protein